MLCLRDGRHYNFHDSLLGMVESSLFQGPVYFNCYPNYSLSLFDGNILHALTLNIKTNGYQIMKGSHALTVVYRIHYKLMKTTLEPQALITSPKGYTLLLQSSTQNSSIQIPKQINWNQVTLPNEWQLENITPTPKIENNSKDNLEYIDQKTDGTVQIAFQPFRRSFSHYSSPAPSSYHTPRSILTSISRNKSQNFDTRSFDTRSQNLDT